MHRLPASAVLWTARSSNVKTGDVPTAWVGRTRAESLASCGACPLKASRNCYAQYGTPAIAAASTRKAAASGADRGLRQALADAIGRIPGSPIAPTRAMRALRWRETARAVARAGLDLVAYTHQWRERTDLAPYAMASCDSVADVDAATARGYRATVVLSAAEASEPDLLRTPAGRPIVVCPAQRSDRVTCNSCRLCAAARPGPVIGFIDHGPRTRSSEQK